MKLFSFWRSLDRSNEHAGKMPGHTIFGVAQFVEIGVKRPFINLGE